MAGHTKWKLDRERRLREGAASHPEYDLTGLDLRLGNMVRERRRELGLTQAEVAELADITQPALSRIEGGGGVPTLAMLDRIAKAMHTTGDLMELNGWSSPQMLRRYGRSAASTRARRTYDRIMED
ncbi:helix-turn-helix domain-containing protein [Actinomadura formosensis]|uniref:helix-turn-helix domain-containing protein n=1 Tax=Actinomadura formosensis TaxID=60706 RepID=UPI003D8C0E6C